MASRPGPSGDAASAQDKDKDKAKSKLGKLVRSSSFKLGKKDKDKDDDAKEVADKKKQKKQKKVKAASGEKQGEPKPHKPSKASQLVRKLSIGMLSKSGKASPTQGSPLPPRASPPPAGAGQSEPAGAEDAAPRAQTASEGSGEARIPYIEESDSPSTPRSRPSDAATDELPAVLPRDAFFGLGPRLDPEPAPRTEPVWETAPSPPSYKLEPLQTVEENLGQDRNATELKLESDAAEESKLLKSEPEPGELTESVGSKYSEPAENRFSKSEPETGRLIGAFAGGIGSVYSELTKTKLSESEVGELIDTETEDSGFEYPELTETKLSKFEPEAGKPIELTEDSGPEYPELRETKLSKFEPDADPEPTKTKLSKFEPEAGKPIELTEDSGPEYPELRETKLSKLEPEAGEPIEASEDSGPEYPELRETKLSKLEPEAGEPIEASEDSGPEYPELRETKLSKFEPEAGEPIELTEDSGSEYPELRATNLSKLEPEAGEPIEASEDIGSEHPELVENKEIKSLEFDSSEAWMSQAQSDRHSKPYSPPTLKAKKLATSAAAKSTENNLEDDIANLLAEERISSERYLQSIEKSIDKSSQALKREEEEVEEFGDNLDTDDLEEESSSLPSEMPAPNVSTSGNSHATAASAQQSGDKREHLYKILVIGELGTGKTSIIKRYVHQFFSQHYRATIGVDFALKVLNWDTSSIIRLQLWDIAGQERFGNMTRVYYKEAVGAFIVFDVTRAATFEAVVKWKQDLDTKVQLPDGSPIPCVLLANKCDQQKEGLVNNPAKMEEYCKEKGFVGWYETSAKENINIEEAAKMLVTKILQNDKLIHQNDTLKDSDKFSIDGKNTSEKSGKSCSC
ncbi:ras-related protein Rab-44-like [Bacillus rossius redtenbacheri]|uniref:ras-related protein Rab-44-like n=1 Tax=Bacillus rossius redtenbacheri TaxID=93214 RepID=UPI002FDE0DB6